MEFSNLLFSVKNKIAYLTINRPDKLNALNFETLDELDAALDEVYENEEIRVALITGAGEKAFVAGADISEIATLDQEAGFDIALRGQRLFARIENCPKPIIAMVNGYALGGGCELAMACHMRIASENAIFAQPEIDLGIIPGYGGTQRLTQLVGKGKAFEIICTAGYIAAESALNIGLINHLCSKVELLSMCEEMAQKLINKPKMGIAKIIESVNSVYDEKQDGYETEARAFGECCSSGDFKEGTSAFLEKRKPNFE